MKIPLEFAWIGIIAILISCAKSQSSKEAPMSSSSQFLTAKLVAMPANEPRCGDTRFASVFKFAIDISQSGINPGIIYIIVLCPDLKGGDFFAIGRTYRISVSSDLEESNGYAIINEFGDEPSPLYLATSIENI